MTKLTKAVKTLAGVNDKREEIVLLIIDQTHLQDEDGNVSFKIPGGLIDEFSYEILKVSPGDMIAKALPVFDEYNVRAVAIYGHHEDSDEIEMLVEKIYSDSEDDHLRCRFVVTLPSGCDASAKKVLDIKLGHDNKICIVDPKLALSTTGEMSKAKLLSLLMKTAVNMIAAGKAIDGRQFVKVTQRSTNFRNRGQKRRGGNNNRGRGKRGRY